MSSRRSFYRTWLAASLLAGVSPVTTVRADEQPLAPAVRVDRLDTLVIEGNEDSGPGVGEVEHADFAGSHQRLSGDTLDRRDIGLGELLAFERGVQSRQSGGFGSFSQITVRAATPAQTGVYLDGIRLDGAADAGFDLATLELLNLEAVDLYRGAAPIELGGNPIGGAIDLVTPEAGAEPTTRLLAGAGSFGTARLQAAHRSRQPLGDLVGAFSAQRSDNDFDFVDDNGTPQNADDDMEVRRRNAGVERVGALAKYRRGSPATGRHTALLQVGARRQAVPEWRNANDNDARFDTDALQSQWTHELERVDGWSRRVTAFAHLRDERFDDRDSEVGLGAQLTDTRVNRLGMTLFGDRFANAGRWAATTTVSRERLEGDDRLVASRSHEVERVALDAHLAWSWFSDDARTIVTPAVGASWYRDEEDTDAGATRRAREADGRAFSPQLSVRHAASRQLDLHASIGDYYRAPSFAELFGETGLVRGSPDLEPERGLNADIGLTWQPRPTARLEAAVFASDRDELITTVFDARGVGRAINVGGARVRGVEVAADLRLHDTLSVRGNLTVQSAESYGGARIFEGRQLPGEARRAGSLRTTFEPDPRWRLWHEAGWRDERYYDQANVLRARDPVHHAIAIEHRDRRWRAALVVTNLTDRRFEDFNGFVRPGRAASLQFTMDL